MKIRPILSFLLIINTLCLFGQGNNYGIDVINYHPIITNASEQNWSIVQDNRGVMYFGNDEDGVLEYDGVEWRSIPMPNKSIVRSLDCSEDGIVFVGAVAEFGYLAPDAAGYLEYISLTSLIDSSEAQFYDVWKTYCAEGKVYFHTQNSVFVYYPESQSINVIPVPPKTLFGYYIYDRFYTGFFNSGLMVLEGDTAHVVAVGGEYYEGKDIFGLTAYDDEHLLVGTTGFGLSLYNITTGEVDASFGSDETNEYLNNNFLTLLTTLDDGSFAASTVQGGVVIIDQEGEIEASLGNEEGLQDQTIYSSYQSHNENVYPHSHLWTAMSFGLGKISHNSYLKEYSESTGFQGLVVSIQSIDNILFIGTKVGLYFADTKKKGLTFTKAESIQRTVWDMDPFTLASGEKVILAIGEDGFAVVRKDGSSNFLRDDIQGNGEAGENEFWGYDLSIDRNNPNRVLLGKNNAINSVIYKNGKWQQELNVTSLPGEVRSTALTNDNKLWFSVALVGIGCLTEFSSQADPIYYGTAHGLPTEENNTIYRIKEELLVATSEGVYRVSESPDSVYFYLDTVYNDHLPAGKNYVRKIYEDPEGDLWFSYKNEYSGWGNTMVEFDSENGLVAFEKPFKGLDNFSTDVFFSHNGQNVWFSNSNKIYSLDKAENFKNGTFNTLVRKVTVNQDSVIYGGAYRSKDKGGKSRIGLLQQKSSIPEIKYSENNIEFRWSAPYFEREQVIEFSYYLEGFSKDWSDWERVVYRDFTNLPHGNYTFRIKSKNLYGDEGVEDTYSFVILRPWYLSLVAFLSYIIGAVLLVYIIIVLYTRRLKNENIRLEGIIQERTAEIMKQKEELTDSIEYASRIQRALLPPDEMLSQFNFEHFILFRPRDIVSGDFYWFGYKNGKIYIVAADCTGHGVPGAFMSMLGISFLDEIVIKSGISETNEILDQLRNHVITSLRQTGQSIAESTKDGMDLAMLAIDEKTHSIQYSGAYNPLFAVRELSKEELKTIAEKGSLDIERGWVHNDTHLLYQVKADQMPIGISEKDYNFNSKVVDEPNLTLYLFSDGYVDQFGGPAGKKFMSKNFKKLILDIQHLPMEKQQKKLEEVLLSWMSNVEQIDDILVIGLRFKK